MASSGTEEDETSAVGPDQMVKVKRKLLSACMTCPICNKLIRDATTISECLHTFCRKCIFEKLDEEETDCCPVCNIHLGCLPVEKLRDGNISVSYIQKYLVKKLNLFNEDEVEITCRNEPVVPTMSLNNVVAQWLRGGTTITKASGGYWNLGQRLHSDVGLPATSCRTHSSINIYVDDTNPKPSSH